MGKVTSSSLGTTTLPIYMRSVHADWLGMDDVNNPGGFVTMQGISRTVPHIFKELMEDAGSPYSAYSYTDPATKITAMETAVGLMLGEKDDLSAIRTNWDATLDSTMAKVATELGADIATIQTLTATEWEDLDDQARLQLGTLLNDTHIHTVLAFFETWSNIYTAVKAKADADITDRSADIADRSSNISDRSTDITEQSSTDRKGDTTDRSGDVVDSSIVALAELDEFSSVYTDILAKINALIEVADYEISDADIATMKTAYKGTINETYEKSLSEFFGGMAALNAINSSAFMIGGAMLMRARDRDLSKFEADLIRDGQKAKIEFQKDRLQYVDAFSRVYASIDATRALTFNQAKAAFESNKKDLMASFETTEAALMSGYEGNTKDLLAAHQANKTQLMASFETEKSRSMIAYETAKAGLMVSYETLYSGFIQDLSKTSATIDASKAQVGSEMQKAYEDRRVDYVSEALKGMVHMLVAQAQLRWQLTGSGTNVIAAQFQGSKDVVDKHISYVIEQKRMAQVMTVEHEERELFLDVKDDLWDLSVYQYGSNVLSAIGAGGGGYIPDGPSPVGQALGGVLGGAAIGTKMGIAIGAAGGPIGAVGGAAIGALIGGLGAYFS